MNSNTNHRQNSSRYNFSPRSFAHRFFIRLGEEASVCNDDESMNGKGYDESREGGRPQNFTGTRLIFREGAYDEENQASKSEKRNMTNIQAINQLEMDLAKKIHSEILMLKLIYGDLSGFGRDNGDNVRQVLAELETVEFAMMQICQSHNPNFVGEENQRKPMLKSFCGGVDVALRYLSQILFDLRSLLRLTEDQNARNQLFVIYITLQSQQTELRQIRQECLEGGER